MTIGDILAVIAAVALAGASWAATLIGTALLFPSVVDRAALRLSTSGGRCVGQGVLAVVAMAIVGAILHTGPLRLLSAGLWCGLALTSAVGGAAVIRLMGERIGWLGSEMSPFARLTRAAALYVGAGFVPVAGWFLLTPIAALATVGAGLGALRKPRPLPMPSMPARPASMPIQSYGHGTPTASTVGHPEPQGSYPPVYPA